MRNQDWNARNAPNGPPMVISCRNCKKPLFSLESNFIVTNKSEGSEKRVIDCVHAGCNMRNVFWIKKINEGAA